ncbi:MAG: hypothetical protein IJF09_01245 [Ruminiclostridium sp.]|nr:hypothetical protein [Ruminiclostridium sp.]
MKNHNKSVSMKSSLFLLIAGIILGTVFTFGMQFWNKKVSREECISLKTKITSCDIIHSSGRPTDIKEIKVNCSDGKSYLIDGVSVTDKLNKDLSLLQSNTEVSLLIHPDSNVLLEIKTADRTYLRYEETTDNLETEKTGFLLLGIFSYFCGVVGLYYTIINFVKGKN